MVIKHFPYILFLFLVSIVGCKDDYGKLELVTKLPKNLKEVSGIAFDEKDGSFWMINDSGNSSKVYKISKEGEIVSTLNIKGKNKDWEDLTFDEKGNISIGDFGNNLQHRKDLRILKISKKDLFKASKVKTKKVNFYYPEQTKFPSKNKDKFFDAEAFFYFNNYFYIFTKSHVKNKYGFTSLYKIPSKKGNYQAILVDSYIGCKEENCAITSAAISADAKKVVLLSKESVLVFSNFENDNFLSGKVKKIIFKHQSQKEGVCFKDNNTLYITDEKANGGGGNLYQIKI